MGLSFHIFTSTHLKASAHYRLHKLIHIHANKCFKIEASFRPSQRAVSLWPHDQCTVYFSHSQNKFTTHGVLANQHTVFTEWRHPLTADIRRPNAVMKLYESGFSPWCTVFDDFATVCRHRWESGLASTFFSKKIDQMVRFLWSFQIVIWHSIFCIIWWFCRFACQTKMCD